MGDIFISYSREDRQAAARVAGALEANGWSVWWDPDIPPGEIWDELIEKELADVRCVVVLWSASSVQKQWVKAEAAEAMARGILVPALIESVKPPLAFRQVQAASLVDWRGEGEHAGFQLLLATIRSRIGSRLQETADAGRSAGTSLRHRTVKQARVPEKSMPQPPSRKQPAAAVADFWRAAAAKPSGSPPAGHRRQRLTILAAAVALLILGGVIGYAVNEAIR